MARTPTRVMTTQCSSLLLMLFLVGIFDKTTTTTGGVVRAFAPPLPLLSVESAWPRRRLPPPSHRSLSSLVQKHQHHTGSSVLLSPSSKTALSLLPAAASATLPHPRKNPGCFQCQAKFLAPLWVRRRSQPTAHRLRWRLKVNDDDALALTPENVGSSNNTEAATPSSGLLGVILDSKLVRAVRQWLAESGSKVAWYLFTFGTGAVLGVTALILPLYMSTTSTNNPLQQPVTLFETILSDLEQAYVDPVDTNRLFETGMAAMLRSLDPYTEFEGVQEAKEMSESIEGRYGGVGLVIAGIPEQQQSAAATAKISAAASQLPPPTSTPEPESLPSVDPASPVLLNQQESPMSSPLSSVANDLENSNDNANKLDSSSQEDLALQKMKEKGIRVVSAFEGYAFDYGLRVGDKIVGIDNLKVDGSSTSIEQVRNNLRGVPGTLVTISFEREGVNGVQSVTMPRAVVKIRDVKLAKLMGDPSDGIGYIQLSGFTADAGKEVRNAIQYLQRAAEDASNGERTLQGLVLDLRGNPGGLLTSAVDVASLLVPKGSDIVSAKGRGFPGIIYRSRMDPILDTTKTKLAVLVNGNTASAAEIVSGAVQDLDVGVIVGADRTFGKGLVQNVEELPYNTALKFTVAKYYTPSGRCIQGVSYKGGDKDANDGMYVASEIEEKDRGSFYTRTGRVVRDGGGIEADYEVPSTKASALEVTLFRSGMFSDFAAEWSKKNELTNNFDVDEDTYKSFQAFVNNKQKNGELQLQALYSKPLEDLKNALKASGYKGSEQSVEQLQARIVRDIQNDFNKYRTELKEDISQSILARYVPESMLIERGIRRDPQVEAAVKLISSRSTFDTLLAKGSTFERMDGLSTGGNLKGSAGEEPEGFRSQITW